MRGRLNTARRGSRSAGGGACRDIFRGRLPALVLLPALFAATTGGTLAKDVCTQSWRKGNFKSSQEVTEEVKSRLANAKILRLSLCTSGSAHYFLVTVLEAAGRVRVIRLPAD